MATLADTVASATKTYPDFKITPKASSNMMKAIDIFLKIITFGQQSNFMASYTTTIGHTIYTPTSWPTMLENDQVIIVRHELIHFAQQVRYGRFLFSVLYLIPYFPVLFSYWRAQLELEAYTETIRASIEIYGPSFVQTPVFKQFLVSQFTGPSYAYMWIFEGQVSSWVDAAIATALKEVD